MRSIFQIAFAILTTFILVGTPVLAEDSKQSERLQKITADPGIDSRLTDDFRFTLWGQASTLRLANLGGDEIGVGQAELRASAAYRFWDEFRGGNIFVGIEARGRATSDTDGFVGDGGFRVNNGVGNVKPLDIQEFSLYATLELHSPSDIRFSGTDIQVAYHLRGGIGATQRNLIEEETLFSAFAELDLSIRPRSSNFGGFIAASFDFSIEPGGHVARLDWEVNIGPELLMDSIFSRLRAYGSISRHNYGVLYKDSNSEELDAIALSQLFFGGGVSANVGPFELFVEATHTRHIRIAGDRAGGNNEGFRFGTNAWTAFMGVKLEF